MKDRYDEYAYSAGTPAAQTEPLGWPPRPQLAPWATSVQGQARPGRFDRQIEAAVLHNLVHSRH